MKQAAYSHFTSKGLGLVQESARGLRRWFPIVAAGADIGMDCLTVPATHKTLRIEKAVRG